MILSYFKDHYFSHFLVLHKSDIFPKREDSKTFNIYVSSPSVEFNTVQTTFVDLSGRGQDVQHSDNNEDKKSDEWFEFYMFFHCERYSKLFTFT